MPAHFTGSPGLVGGLPARRRPVWPVLALAVALAWCAGAKPAPKSDAPPPTGIPYEGIDAKQLKALAGTTVDLVPVKGKTFKNVELVKVTPGKQTGTLQSIAFKSAEGGPTRNLRAGRGGPPRGRHQALRRHARPPAQGSVSVGRYGRARRAGQCQAEKDG